tara:strand:- start:9496 stop:9759 length:264 start_codon:yes stop_codon:yes gene_type:complete
MRYSFLLFSILVGMIFYLNFENSKKETMTSEKTGDFNDENINDLNLKIDGSAYYKENYSTKKFWIEITNKKKNDLPKTIIGKPEDVD